MSGCLPLSGIRVIDFGQAVAVPSATQCLALMGAEVILVESHQRLASRGRPPFADNEPGLNRSGHFNFYHVGKYSCTVNLRTEAGREIVRELVSVSDLVTENYSTGTMDRFGLGYKDLVKLRPDIIVLSMSAAGRTGPMKDFVGYHSAVLMLSGLAAILGYPQGHPRVMGSVFPDPVSGMYAVFAVLCALHRRSKTGLGQYIDLAMTEAMMTLMPEAIIDYTLNGREGQRRGNQDPLKSPHGVYRCKGAEAWVAISVGSEDQWNALCSAVGRKEWSSDPRFSDALVRWQHQQELDALIQEWTRERTSREVTQLLQQQGVPAGPSFTTADLIEDPHLRQRGFIVEVDHQEVGRRPMGSVPWKITELPNLDYRPAPLIGHDNQHVVCELLGRSHKELQRLAGEGVIH